MLVSVAVARIHRSRRLRYFSRAPQLQYTRTVRKSGVMHDYPNSDSLLSPIIPVCKFFIKVCPSPDFIFTPPASDASTLPCCGTTSHLPAVDTVPLATPIAPGRVLALVDVLHHVAFPPMPRLPRQQHTGPVSLAPSAAALSTSRRSARPHLGSTRSVGSTTRRSRTRPHFSFTVCPLSPALPLPPADSPF